MNYVVATIKPWNIAAFKKHKGKAKNWKLIDSKEGLNLAALDKIKPRYIFFPHWSWIVPEEILNKYECVCFHMTDVPYGRGGSPLQNLIVRGHESTKMTALRMEKGLDTGPVYMKRPLSLKGRAQDIFERSADLVYEMMQELTKKEPMPKAQKGKVTAFKRRKPEESELPKKAAGKKLYDHIRMLDAETYPPAFIQHGEFVITFKDAKIGKDGAVSAKAEIRKAK